MKVKKLYEDAQLPVRANPTDSGMDVFAHNIKKFYDIEETLFEDVTTEHLKSGIHLAPGERALIGVGIACSVEEGFEIQARPKSGRALKEGLSIVNTPGTIDCHYRDEIGIIAINLSNDIQEIKYGQKLAQLVVAPVTLCDIEEVEELDATDRGKGGFGSTGL